MNPTTHIISARSKSLKTLPSLLLRYRDLLYTLAWKDVKVQYAQTFFGILWALVNPVVTLVILTFVFSTVTKTDVQGIPHPLYTLAGMCGWVYFSTVFIQAGNAMVGAQAMIKKIYFPRLVIPLSKALTALIDLVILLIGFGVLSIIYGYPLSPNLVFLPCFIFMIILSGLAGGIWMSALTIRYRDIHHIAPLLVRLGLFITPIAYAADSVPKKYEILYYLNPLAGIVEGMKWSLLGTNYLSPLCWLSIAVTLLLFCSSIWCFTRMEHKVADIL